MNKFNAGDKVIRTDRDYCMAEKGGIYEVASCTDGGGLELVGHPQGSGGLAKYSSGSFELVQVASTANTTNTTEEILMSKFNVGDIVKRTFSYPHGNVVRGGEYTVSDVRADGALQLDGDRVYQYDEAKFELVGSIGGLSDKEVFNAIVDGKPLQYKFVGKPEWYDLKYPEKLTLLDVQRGTYRVRPTEVHIDCTVPYPICKREVTRAFSVDFTNGRITEFFTVVLPDKGVFWNTKEEAEKFRDAVLASLKA